MIYLILCLNSWAFMILFLALGMRFLDFTNRQLKYLGEAAMPFYLLHHPVIVFIAFYVTHIPISPWAQLTTIGISAVADYRLAVSSLHPPLESTARRAGHVAPKAWRAADHPSGVGGAGRVWRRYLCLPARLWGPCLCWE